MILKTDCKLFPGNKPCVPNKTEGKMCDDCNYYEPVSMKILIIKLDAIGDVLRTTSILPSLKRKYPISHITWITKKNSGEIFNNNNLVDQVLFIEDNDAAQRLSIEKYDLLLHPDASPNSAPIATIVGSKIKKGFILDEKGKIIPVDGDAVEWLEIGAFDQLKKKNKKTYQQIIHELCGLSYERDEIQLFLSDAEKKIRDDFYTEKKLKKFKKIIGLNTGAGNRWQYKQWSLEGFEELISKLSDNKGIGILLYGGPSEEERNKYLISKFPFLVNTGTDNSLREFFSLMDISDIIITGDTLALHAATALKKDIICVFGPTSYNEIEDYGRIRKIYSDLDCLVCYKTRCDFKTTCMGEISSERIYREIINILNN
jgi:lipopolysaccharide heptosyltransferase III